MFLRWSSRTVRKKGEAEAHQLALDIERNIEAKARQRLLAMTAIFETLEPGWETKLDDGAAFVLAAGRYRAALRTVRQSGTAPQPDGLQLQLSSLFLKDCHAFLTGDDNGRERLVLISGSVSDDGVRVLSRMVHVPNTEATPAYVSSDPKVTHKTIVQLVEHDGHGFFGMFHSHIMHGANSTRPSGVDLAHQERLVAGGWTDVIGGIFSLDGYVRLFSTAQDFCVTLYGNGADLVSDGPRDKIIKLTLGG